MIAIPENDAGARDSAAAPAMPLVPEVDELEAKHVNETVRLLSERSNIIAERLASGKVAIVGATYHLAEGRVTKRDHVGDIGE